MEATRTFVVGQDILDVQDPPRVFAAEVVDSLIVDLTEVRVGLHLVGAPSGGGFASEMYVALTKDLAATAVLLNQVGVTTADGGGFGYDGWDVTFRDDGVLGDVHLLDAGLGLLSGEVQPDGRLVPEATSRPALLSALNGLVGNGTWRLAVGDAYAGGMMRLESWSLTLAGRTNRAPTFVGLSDMTVEEGVAQDVALPVQDADVPEQPLTIALVEGPAGAAVVGGRFQWTPPETAGGMAHVVRVSVSDGVDATTNSFEVVVTEVNQAPSFPALADITLPDLSPYVLALVATDADVPVQALEFELLSGPEGSEVVMGEFRWTPIPEQRPSTNVVVVRVTDGSASVTNQFSLRLVIPNTAPTFGAMADPEVVEGAGLGLNLPGMDADEPANSLAYSLVSGPTGMTVSATGRLAWTPTEADGPGVYAVTVQVEDDGSPPLSGTMTFNVTVAELNREPAFGLIPDVFHNEGIGLTMALAATDPDLPAQALVYSLVSGPAGLTLSSAGVLEWTPTEAQGPGVHPVRVRVTDGAGAQGRADFSITVQETPSAPVLPALGPFTFPEMAAWTQALGGGDADLPAQALTYSLVSGPAGLVLGADGVLAWTPAEAQGPGTFSVTVRLSDETGLSAERSYTLNVSEVNLAPVAMGQQLTGTEDTPLAVGLSATDADGNPMSYSVVSSPRLGTLVGVPPSLTYIPAANAFGPDEFTFKVNDGLLDSGMATVSITIVPVNDLPVAEALAITMSEDVPAPVTLTGSDVESSPISFEVVTLPSKGALSGIPPDLIYTPDVNAIGSDSFSYRVWDGVAYSAPATASVTLTAVNDAPSFVKGSDQAVLDNAGPVTVAGWATGVTAGPADESGQGLAFVVEVSDPGLFTVAPAIASDGTLTYTPKARASGTAVVTVRLQDDGGTANGGADTSVTQTFTVAVQVRPRVVGRWLFYNGSRFDGNSAALGAEDDAAVASNKSALRAGGESSFANVSSYSKGINGVMVDVVGLAGTPTASDFGFRVGRALPLTGWVEGPAPTLVAVRAGAGVDGSDRVTLRWADSAIRNQWLEVTVKAGGQVGLEAADVFYFGNVVGETGNDLMVTITDVAQMRAQLRFGLMPVTWQYDVNRDGLVNTTDVLLVRLNRTVDLTKRVQTLNLTGMGP